MVNNYSFTIPLDHSQCLKVILCITDKQVIANDHSSQQNPTAYTGSCEKDVVELSDLNELPGNIIQAINTAYAAFTNRVNLPHSFMVSTATGFQLLRLNQILYFEYMAERKQWMVLLTDQMQLPLKRNTIAENILSYSHDFVQINQHHIINLKYLVRIDGRSCQLSIPSVNENKLIISRSFLKGLQGRMEMI